MEPQTERTYFTTTGAAEYICQVLGIDHVPDRPERPLDAAFIRDLRKDHFPNAKKKGREWQIPTEEVDAWIKQSGLTPPSRWKRIYKSAKNIYYLIEKRRLATLIVWLSLLGTFVTLYQWYMPQDSTPPISILATPTWTSTVTPTATPTPTITPTPILFSPAVKNETLVLIADILIEPCIEDPACADDPNNVTQRLIDSMREALVDHPHIRVERLKQYIYEEGGSELAMEIGKRPEHNAAFVMWGNYVVEPDAEVYVFFDIMERTLPVFGNSYDEGYGSSHIQPTMFEFKADLGTHWGQLTAFAAALTLYQDHDYKNAIPLFDTAAQGIDSPLFQGMERVLHFYRGSNYLNLNNGLAAKSDLEALKSEEQLEIVDDLTIAILHKLGYLYSALGDRQESLEYYNQALPLSIEVGDKLGQAATLNNIGMIYSVLGDKQESLEYYNQALPLFQEVGDKAGQATTLNNIGLVYSALGNKQAALEYYNQALPLSIEAGDKSCQACALSNIGGVYFDLGDKQQALDYYNQALSFSIEVGNKSRQTSVLTSIGFIYSALGDKQEALEYYNQALPLSIEVGDTWSERRVRRNKGRLYASLGEFHQAEEQMMIVIQIGETVGHPGLEQDRRELGIIQALLAGQ